MAITLKELLNKQRSINEDMGWPLGHGEKGVFMAMVALMNEVSEVMGEINWKPWKKRQKVVDREKLLTEIFDTLQFGLNAVNALGADAEEFERIIRAKWKVNEQVHIPGSKEACCTMIQSRGTHSATCPNNRPVKEHIRG